MEVPARRNGSLVALDHGIHACKLHPPGGTVHPLPSNQLVERDLGRRADAPCLELGMLIDDASAEELDRAEVFLHLRLEADGLEALAGEFVRDQRSVGLRDRAKEARGGIADRIELSARDVEFEDVRGTRV